MVIGKYSCINIFSSIWVQLVCSLTCFEAMVILRDYYLSLQHMVSLSDHFCFLQFKKGKTQGSMPVVIVNVIIPGSPRNQCMVKTCCVCMNY